MAKLIFRLTPGESLDFLLLPGVTRLGRHPSSEIVINNTWISSRHAEFHRSGENFTVRDAGSSNGTSVNGETITIRELKDGDRISFGQLEAVYDAELLTTPAVPPAVGPPVVVPSKATHSATAPLKTPGAVPAPVVVRAMAAPPASIAYDLVRKEGELELEELRKKRLTAHAATEEALQERTAAQAALDATRREMETAEKGLRDIHLTVETARSRAVEDAAALATSRKKASAELASLIEEITTLTAPREAMERDLAALEGTALADRASALKALADCQEELTGAQSALHKTVSDHEDCRSEFGAAQAALTAAQSTLRKLVIATNAAQADHDQLLIEIQTSTAALQELKKESDQSEQEASQWPERSAAAETALDALDTRIAAAREAACAEEHKLSAQLQAVDQLKLQHNTLSAKISQGEQQEAAAQQASARWAAMEMEAAQLREEAAQTLAARSVAAAALAQAAARQVALTEEAAAVQSRLDHLRRETEGAEALNSKVTDLRQQQGEAERRLEFLNDRLAGMSEAPDPNWGTVHSLARSFIKKLDLIDDLIVHLTGQPEAVGTLGQLSVFRSGLIDILKEYSIEAYSLEPGTVIDVAARKRIQIVETLSEGIHDGTRIVRTYRPGYVCRNGDLGIPTLLRKADVAVSIPLS